MKKILLFGAGKSATCLIDFLLNEIVKNDWHFTVCDSDLSAAQLKIGNAQNAKAVSIFVENEQERKTLIESSDIVISLLPATLHFLVAKDCLEFNKNLLTASYVDENSRSLKDDIKDKGLLFLYEMGLDPGIDHMSAMKIINSIRDKGGKITSFKSHCGGLVAAESDNNPWHYKITWNPRNVVLAGKDGAVYRKENKTINIPYTAVFRNSATVSIPNLAELAWYPNRDSINYINVYALDGISTFLRTTLRYPAFCRAWNKLVNIGCTDTADFEKIKNCKTFFDWYQLKLSPFITDKKDWNNYLNLYITDPFNDEFSKQRKFLGLRSHDALPAGFTCSADILQHLMENKLAMAKDDKDMIVMLHEIEYELDNKKQEIKSSLIVRGEDSLRTAMAKTVGLPLGIAAKLILEDKINLKGLHIPTVAEIYEPVLAQLEQYEIAFSETCISL